MGEGSSWSHPLQSPALPCAIPLGHRSQPSVGSSPLVPTGTHPLLAPAPSPLRASDGHGHLLSLRGCRRARARAWGQRESGGTGAAPTTRDGGNGARAELWMWVFNYTIKCTIRYNYQCSEAATVHNRHVIYCSHCLYCSALLPNDYGKLSHLHGCHGNWVRG